MGQFGPDTIGGGPNYPHDLAAKPDVAWMGNLVRPHEVTETTERLGERFMRRRPRFGQHCELAAAPQCELRPLTGRFGAQDGSHRRAQGTA